MGHIKLEDAVDLHCHFGPDFINPGHDIEPSVSALQAATEAAEAGMKAIVLKSHDFSTAHLAHTLREVVPGVCTCGGIVLDHQAGGLNPFAVEHALRLGARIVWLPTVASRQDHINGIGKLFGYPGTGIYCLDDDGALLPEVNEILDLVHDHGAVIATGHTTAEEHYQIARAFGRRGKVVVTHACEQMAGPHLSQQQCVELAGLGAYIELTAQLCVAHLGMQPKPVDEVARMIHAIGPEQVVLATDYGWTRELPNPAQGLRDYVDGLWAAGVAERDLRRMACDNGARLLGLKD